jgi:hypothetical protein
MDVHNASNAHPSCTPSAANAVVASRRGRDDDFVTIVGDQRVDSIATTKSLERRQAASLSLNLGMQRVDASVLGKIVGEFDKWRSLILWPTDDSIVGDTMILMVDDAVASG